MSNLGQKLLTIKEDIQEMQKEEAICQGQLKEKILMLTNDYKCTTLEDLQKLLDKEGLAQTEIRDELQGIVSQLQEIGWEV